MVIGGRALHMEKFTANQPLNDEAARDRYEGEIFMKTLVSALLAILLSTGSVFAASAPFSQTTEELSPATAPRFWMDTGPILKIPAG